MLTASMSVANPVLRRLSSRTPRALSFNRLVSPAASLRVASFARFSSPALAQSKSNFSTMAALNSAAGPTTAGPRDYDPEIKDMASYIHNYKIDSDLAVRRIVRLKSTSDPQLIACVVRHCQMGLPRHPWLRS